MRFWLPTFDRETRKPSRACSDSIKRGGFWEAFETDPMPGGLALDKDGLLYVTHMMKHKVAVYDPAGKLVREFGKQGAAARGV